MQLFLDLDSGHVTRALEDYPVALASPLAVTGGQDLPLSLQLHRSGVVCGAPAGSSAWLLGVKPLKSNNVGAFEDAAYLTSVSAWSIPGSGTAPLTATLPLLTDPIKAALGYTGSPSTDTMLDAIVGTVCEIEYVASGASHPTKSSRFSFTIYNWVNQGDEGLSAPSTPPYATRIATLEAIFSAAITGLTGGGATNLDGIATVALAVPQLRLLYGLTGSGLRAFVLQAGTTAADGASIIHPTDYDAATNAKIWVSAL